MMAWRGIGVLCAVLAASGCSGLNQFPETAVNYAADLGVKDPDYAQALEEMKKTNADQVAIRNRLIDQRLRVIDLRFGEFQRALARDNVTANFGIAIAQMVVGGIGAVASEATSQALSATGAALAGGQQAYSKAALYEQTMSALLSQMIAARNSVLVRIMDGRGKSIGEYPLSAASQDLETYLFAGSLPGAVVATAADAKVKNDDAEAKLKALRTNVYTESESKARIMAFIYPPDGDSTKAPNDANVKAVDAWIDKSSVKGLPIANFLTNKELDALRVNMIRELSIPERKK